MKQTGKRIRKSHTTVNRVGNKSSVPGKAGVTSLLPRLTRPSTHRATFPSPASQRIAKPVKYLYLLRIPLKLSLDIKRKKKHKQ